MQATVPPRSARRNPSRERSLGLGVGAHVVDLHRLRECGGAVRIAGPVAADGDVEDEEERVVVDPGVEEERLPRELSLLDNERPEGVDTQPLPRQDQGRRRGLLRCAGEIHPQSGIVSIRALDARPECND